LISAITSRTSTASASTVSAVTCSNNPSHVSPAMERVTAHGAGLNRRSA
jgi:hypothetical protein